MFLDNGEKKISALYDEIIIFYQEYNFRVTSSINNIYNLYVRPGGFLTVLNRYIKYTCRLYVTEKCRKYVQS